jgi:hypothetical protein
MQSNCFTCEFRPDRLFCDMPAESLKAFDQIKSLGSYPAARFCSPRGGRFAASTSCAMGAPSFPSVPTPESG